MSDTPLWRRIAHTPAPARGFDEPAGWLHPAASTAIEADEQSVAISAMFEAIATVAGYSAAEVRGCGLDLNDPDDRRAVRRVVNDLSEAVRVLRALAAESPTRREG